MRIWPAMLLILPLLTAGCSNQNVVEIREIFHYDTPGWAHDVSLERGNIYVADRQGGYLTFSRAKGYKPTRIAPVRDVISLSPNSGMPLLASRFEGLVLVSLGGQISDSHSNGEIANAVEVRDGFAYAAYGLKGLVIMRLSGGRSQLLSVLPTTGWSHDLRLSRDQALVADWNGLRVIDVGDPARPSESALLRSPGTSLSLSVLESTGDRMVAVAEGHAGIAVVRLDSAGKPTLVSRNYLGLNPKDAVHPKSGGWVHSVAWAGKHLFAANWKLGLFVLDCGDLRDLQVILRLPTSGTSLGVKAERQPDGSYLVFLADGESGLRVFHFKSR